MAMRSVANSPQLIFASVSLFIELRLSRSNRPKHSKMGLDHMAWRAPEQPPNAKIRKNSQKFAIKSPAQFIHSHFCVPWLQLNARAWMCCRGSYQALCRLQKAASQGSGGQGGVRTEMRVRERWADWSHFVSTDRALIRELTGSVNCAHISSIAPM